MSDCVEENRASLILPSIFVHQQQREKAGVSADRRRQAHIVADRRGSKRG